MPGILSILLLFFVTSAFANCGDTASLKGKINQLKIEAACSSISLHECLPLLRSFSRDEKVLDPSRGERCDLELSSFSTPVAKFVSTIAEGQLLRHTDANLFVNSQEEFFEHSRLHKERVKVLGMELFRTHPELFKGLTPTQLRIALEAHDRAKVSAVALGLRGRPLYEELYQSYGKKAPDDLVSKLNQVDEKYMQQALAHAGLNDSPQMTAAERARRKVLREQIKVIERIADLVDRGKSPVTAEEFGRPIQAASSYLKNSQEVRLARELERNYSRLTTNLEYRPLTTSQKGRIARQIMRSKSFSSILRKNSYKAISLRAMSYQAIRRAKYGLAGLLQKLASPVAKRVLFAADIVTLYFAEMEQLGCSGIGYHDWIKNPNCEPAIGLTPKIIKFLNEDFATQLDYLHQQPGTCKVITETYRESIQTPIVKSCSPQLLVLELGERNQVRIHLDSRKRMKQIELGNLGRQASDGLRGNPEKIDIGSDGRVSKVCYKTGGRDSIRTCVDRGRKGNELQKMNEFMMSINFQIQKAINSCL